MIVKLSIPAALSMGNKLCPAPTELEAGWKLQPLTNALKTRKINFCTRNRTVIAHSPCIVVILSTELSGFYHKLKGFRNNITKINVSAVFVVEQAMYCNVTSRRLRAITVVGQKQWVLRIMSVYVFEASVTQHAKRTSPIVLSSVACLALQYCSTLSHKRHDFLNRYYWT